MQPVGAVRLVPHGEVYTQIFEDEVQLVRSLDEARKKSRCSIKSKSVSLVRDSETSTEAGSLPCNQQKGAEGVPYQDFTEKPLPCREATTFQKAWKSKDVIAAEEVRALPDFVVPEETRSNILELLSERRQGRHDEAVTLMYHELACIAREIEPMILEPGKLFLTKLMESDRKIEILFTKIELDATVEGFPIEGLEELWTIIQQESLARKKCVRELDETLKKVEWSRTDKITDVLRKYTVMLEEISFFLSADIYRFMNNEAMLINRALLANQRAISKLFFNLMKSEMKRELSLRLKWQDRVKNWKLTQKNYIVQSFREFMVNEEIQNPPAVKTEMEIMINGQILLNEKRLEILQHLVDLLPPACTQDEVNEWYKSLVNLNKSMDAHNRQCMLQIRTQYEAVQQKCLAEVQLYKNKLLNLNVCTQTEAEETVNSDLLQWTEKLQSQFEEELKNMDRDFEELAKQNEQNCRDLYSYFQQASSLWDVHQFRLSKQEGELQKKLDECRQKQNKLIQMTENNLDIILDKMRTAGSEKKLKKCLENALSSLDDIRARYETFNKVLVDKVTSYPEAILQELISYSVSISKYFNVKEVFKQNLEGKIESTFQGQVEVLEAESLVEQQAESIVQENEENQKMDSSQRQNEETNTAENEEIFAWETEETEKQEDKENTFQESNETDDIEQGDVLNSSEVEISEIATETFSTSSGNIYTVLGAEEAEETDIPEIYFTKYEEKESLPVYLEHVLIKETIFVELKKRIRRCFFEHLEKWFAESLSNSCATVAAKEEELNSELQQHLLLHQPRQENIETNIYNVRAAELLLHEKRLECHCAGVVEALNKERAEFLKLCGQQNDTIKNLNSRIHDMESVFLGAPVTEKLVSFSNSVHSELLNHLEVIQVSLRSYRNYLEEALGKLRDSNVDFLKACRLFCEGGNFSPEEVESFSKHLQKKSEHIDSFERLIMADMEKMESSCLEQATELVNQAETKFHYLFTNRVFMEKIQRLLTNLRLQIKSEVANSNLQAATLKSYLEKLHQKIDTCAHSTADKEALTSEELYNFTKVLLKELRKRSQYLDCLLVGTRRPYDNELSTPPAAEVTLQGPIAVAIRTECRRDAKILTMMGLDPVKFPLLNPSRMGKSAVDDLAVNVIQNLLDFRIKSSWRKSSDRNQDRNVRSHSLGPANLPTPKNSHLNVSDGGPQKSATYKHAARVPRKSSISKKMPRGSIQKHTRPVLNDKRYQIFGEKPPESDTFKGIIMNILWTGNNNLLCLAEEFYQKEKHQMTMPEDLPETFEHCAEMFRQNLLSYQSQTDGYYNSCLKEFQDQLKLFEEELPYVSWLAVDSLLKEHEQKLSSSADNIRHLFNKQLEDWESVKVMHKNQLCPSLGHPDNLLQLEALCQEELKRQKDQAEAIHLNTEMLRDCATECAQNFVSALAAFTEKLLLELDESITIDDIQVPNSETPREKTSVLIRRKEAGLPLEICKVEQLIERGSRTWPGIPTTTLTDNSDYIICKETASVTAAKTTLGHIAVVEARDAVYKKYICKLEQHFAQIKKESSSQLVTVQHWENWWKQSIQKIKQFYM
ncbi:coiled-coil domain-containing protein 180 isoform X2 [Oxyura jamaicensis]|uniref:coiled-coil domain-containing protein 180 isoform X2 n=1 Tax=Oxyura jamaicensis TaxID=8884 RepID=UPI0015A5A2D1|nr:coiled-coil domain-containing protein 180 isoform X2 [Oxyura jamaicensis]